VRVVLDVSAVPARPVGAGVYIVALGRGLNHAAEIDLHLLSRGDDANRWTTIAPGAVVHAVAPARRPLRLAWEQLSAPTLANEVDADVWHGPHYTLPLRVSSPTLVTVHDLTFFEHPEWHERSKVAYFRRMIRAAVSRADVVICVSAYTEARLRAHCSPRGDVVVVPHGVDHARFHPVDDAAADLKILRRYGIEPPFIAFSGTIEPRKNLPSLVHAFARIAAAEPDLRLVLAGADGWGADAVRDAIATSGIATHVQRPGYLDDDALTALFRQAVAVVYPSLEEGFGLPALEALACGTPLISTRGSAVEELAGDAAVLVTPGDVDALADAIARVVTDHELRSRLSADGLARAATFTWERSVAGHLDAYRRAAKTKQ
jgi:glycosyltransferase involved in cell wall biosynthesis